MSEPFVVAVTCVRRRPWAAPLWIGAMAVQARRPDGALVVVDEPEQGEGTFSAWDAALREEGGCGFQAGSSQLPVPNWDKRKPWFLETYPHPSAKGWHRGTRESGWREVPEGVAGRYTDDQHAHLARLRNWTVERAMGLWPQASHLWFCDSDVAPEPDVLELLLAADKEVVAAVVRNGERAWNFMMRLIDGEPLRSGYEGSVLDLNRPEPFVVSMTGACTLYRRKVFELRGHPADDMAIVERSGGFSSLPLRGNEPIEQCGEPLVRWGAHPRGEDIAFAIEVRRAGVELWIEPRARTQHYMELGRKPLR